jgi:transcriptional regulator with XRE-family HTH domain
MLLLRGYGAGVADQERGREAVELTLMFCESLKNEQLRLGLTQPQLAELLDVSPRVIWKWLNEDENPPSPITQEGALARLAKEVRAVKYSCPLCDLTFPNSFEAREHIAKHKPNRIQS